MSSSRCVDNPRTQPERWIPVTASDGSARIPGKILDYPSSSDGNWGFFEPLCSLLVSGMLIRRVDVFFNLAESKGVGKLEPGSIVEATVLSHIDAPAKLCGMALAAVDAQNVPQFEILTKETEGVGDVQNELKQVEEIDFKTGFPPIEKSKLQLEPSVTRAYITEPDDFKIPLTPVFAQTQRVDPLTAIFETFNFTLVCLESFQTTTKFVEMDAVAKQQFDTHNSIIHSRLHQVLHLVQSCAKGSAANDSKGHNNALPSHKLNRLVL